MAIKVGGVTVVTDDREISNLALGSAAEPAISFTDDANTGLFSPETGALALSTNGSEKVRITSDGKVGIGTNTPGELLTLQQDGPVHVVQSRASSDTTPPVHYFRKSRGTHETPSIVSGEDVIGRFDYQIWDGTGYASVASLDAVAGATTSGNGAGYLTISTKAAGEALSEKVRISSAGFVGIGTNSPQHRFQVAGNSFFEGAIMENVYAIPDGPSVQINPTNGTIQTWTLGANRSPTAPNFQNGQSVTLMIDDGLSRTINWAGLAPTPIAVVNSSSAQFGSSASGDLSMPAGLQKGDIVIVGVGKGTGTMLNLPDGWINIEARTQGTESARVFYKVMESTPDTSVTITGLATSSAAVAVGLRFGNMYSITYNSAAGGSGMPNPPVIENVLASSMILAFGMLDDDNVAASVVPPTGYTLLESIQASTTGQTVMVSSLFTASAGNFTPSIYTGTGSDEWVGITVAVPTRAVAWKGGTAPTLPASGYGVIELWKVDGMIYGAGVGDMP